MKKTVDSTNLLTVEDHRRIQESHARARRASQSHAIRIHARLDLAERVQRAEQSLTEAEVMLARCGLYPEEPERESFWKRLRGRRGGGRSQHKTMNRPALESLVETRRQQLERLVNVEGPRAMEFADQAARVIEMAADDVTPPIGLADSEGPIVLVSSPAESIESSIDEDFADTLAKPTNGRSQRSPWG